MHRRQRRVMMMCAAALTVAASLSVVAAREANAQPLSRSALIHLVPTLGPHVSGTTETQESTNWSGYIATGPRFTAVSANWVVPSVQPSEAAEYSATWVGIDGVTTSSLIQTGTSQQTSGDTTTYYAWYEMLPAASVPIYAVSPGDAMHASVVEDSTGTWTIALDDVTSGQDFSQEFSYSSPGTSAEWIEEAPTVNNEQTDLANFGTAQFTNIGTTNSNSSSVVDNPVDLVNSSGRVLASPGPLSNNAFTVTDSTPVPSPASTSTTASVNPSSTIVGSSVTYSTTVTSAGGTPTGTVTFAIGGTALCATGLVNGSGSCTATNAPVGSDSVSALYAGNSEFAGSSGTTSLAVVPVTHGYWLVGSDGGIFTFGSAQFHGSTGSITLQRPVVGITPTADRAGYWLVASDGGVFAFGDAGFFGSIPGMGISPAGSAGGGQKLNAPIVGIVPSADGNGYFMVAADGGVFAFGDAKFEGSCPGIGGCSGAAVTVMPDASGNGYWLVTATGHVYTFGDAAYYGEPGPQSTPVTSAVRTPDGAGYWVLLANGTVDAYGDAGNLGESTGQPATDPATAIFTTSDGHGYWVTSATGAVSNFGDAPDDGGTTGTQLNGSIIAATGF